MNILRRILTGLTRPIWVREGRSGILVANPAPPDNGYRPMVGVTVISGPDSLLDESDFQQIEGWLT